MSVLDYLIWKWSVVLRRYSEQSSSTVLGEAMEAATRTGACIEREVRINLTAPSGEWMGLVYYTSNDQTEDDLYWAGVANDGSRGFDSEEAAINYIEECWEANHD